MVNYQNINTLNDNSHNLVECIDEKNNLVNSETNGRIINNNCENFSEIGEENLILKENNSIEEEIPHRKMRRKTNRTKRNTKNVRKTTKKEKVKEFNKEKQTNLEENTNTKKVNAFDLMMESRNKVIGRNSPGKDLRVEEKSVEEPTLTDERKKRKAFINELLEDWAEEKGASKRQKKYEEETVCIKNKLELRAKNLKEMLKIDNENEEINSRPKRRRINAILSDSDSQDSITYNSDLKSIENASSSSLNGITKSNKSNKSNKNGKVDKEWKIKIKLDLNVEDKVEDTNKRVLRTRKPKKLDEDYLSLSDDDIFDKKPSKTSKKPVKIAPVFAKSLPRPKLSPEALEARRQFLLSGVPSSLKKELIKQQSFTEIEFDVFPTISHVQQKTSSNFWNLPKIELNLIEMKPLKLKSIQIMCKTLTNIQMHETLKDDFKPKAKIENCKKFIKEIKNNNPNYPVYKVFKQINEKFNGNNLKKNCKENSSSNSFTGEKMWTEKYKPKSSNDILGNYKSIESLKKWLVNWYDFGINGKVQMEELSESEFDSNDSVNIIKSPQNTIILNGPVGCGKSTAVYAICNELGFNVLELNASSKRTGRKLLQELQEATQSHQVQKSNNQLTNFLEKNKNKIPENTKTKKMCVLLVEDVDLVFEQDEGFLSALSHLILTSKRPIILTTTDHSSNLIQKFLLHNQTIRFKRLSTKILSIWLQILCLIEGIYVNQNSLIELLDYNRGDIRKSLLQLEYWTKSGGQFDNKFYSNQRFIKKIESISDDEYDCLDDDDNSNVLADNNEDINTNLIHFMKVTDNFRLNRLDLIWWNFSNLFSTPDYSTERIRKFFPQTDDNNTLKKLNCNDDNCDKEKDRKKLKLISKFYDNLIVADCMKFTEWNSTKLKDSLELDERKDDYYDNNYELSNDLGRELITGSLKKLNQVEDSFQTINMALPNQIEERWLSKVALCDKTLGAALGSLSYLERTSISVDYQPFLRNIARSELKRSLTNTKRGNRFYNYLNNLNINCRDNVYKLACNILTD